MTAEQIKHEIDRFMSSDRRPPSATRDDLLDIADHLEICIESLSSGGEEDE